MATNNIEIQPILVDSDVKNIANRLITPSTQTFYAHKATETEYGVVTLGQINKAVSDHNEDPNAHTVIITPLKNHITDTNNPHKVTKEQVGLGNVPNVNFTQELDKKVDKVVEKETLKGKVVNEINGTSIKVSLNVDDAQTKVASVTADNSPEVLINATDLTAQSPNPSFPAASFVNVKPLEIGISTLGDVKIEANKATLNGKKILTESDVNLSEKVDKIVTKVVDSKTYTTNINNAENGGVAGEIKLTALKTSEGNASETLLSVGSEGFQVVTSDNEKTGVLVVTPDEISIGDNVANLNPLATQKYVDNKILDITAIRIRNVDGNPINATIDTVQTVATNYIVTKLGRQPETYDGLFITLTDKDNDVVEYAYFGTTWVNVGINGADLSNYVNVSETQTITGDKNFTGKLQHNGLDVATTREAQKIIILGADGVEETQAYNFTVKDVSSYLPYRTSGTKFLVDLYLPISGDLTKTKKVAITFGDTTYYVYNILKGGEAITIGDLHQVDKYNNATGYRFISEMIFFQTTDLTGFYIIPTVSMSDVLALDSDEMDTYMAEGGLTQGQLAICSKVINNGYTAGALYRFDITYPTTYTWTELAGTGGGLTVLQSSDFPLSADLLAKVKANPQNYCYTRNNKTYLYSYFDSSFNRIYYSNYEPFGDRLSLVDTRLSYSRFYIDNEGKGQLTSENYLFGKTGNIEIGTGSENKSIKAIGVFAKTANQNLSGDDLYLATTIDIGDEV